MHVKSTEERFAEIVAEVELGVETRSVFDWRISVNNEVLAVLRSMQSKLAWLQEENADQARAISYLQKGGWTWSVEE